jgi:hypothetical protein
VLWTSEDGVYSVPHSNRIRIYSVVSQKFMTQIGGEFSTSVVDPKEVTKSR